MNMNMIRTASVRLAAILLAAAVVTPKLANEAEEAAARSSIHSTIAYLILTRKLASKPDSYGSLSSSVSMD